MLTVARPAHLVKKRDFWLAAEHSVSVVARDDAFNEVSQAQQPQAALSVLFYKTQNQSPKISTSSNRS
jgi:hypothetical protein